MRERIRLAMVAARGRNGVIGREGDLPWRLPSDLQRFKATTMGKPVLMGRRTWESLPKALPGRPNLVVSRDPAFRPKGAWAFSSLPAALAAGEAMARAMGAGEVSLIGGGVLYAALIEAADRLYLTEVDAEPAGDARFPAFDEAAFETAFEERVTRGPEDDYAFTVRILDRR